VPDTIHRVPNVDVSWVLADLQERRMVFAMPTYEYKRFPPMARAGHFSANGLVPQGLRIAVSVGGRGPQGIREQIAPLK
jgi:hypothetical protein